MIAFGSSISGGEAYRRYAQPGIRLASEPDSVNFAYAAVEPIGRTYNLILDAAARHDDLEALVLVHPHTEIIDPGFCAKVRAALAHADVGMVGVGGRHRRARDRLVGGRGHLRAGDPSLRGARLRRHPVAVVYPARHSARRGGLPGLPAAGALAVGGAHPPLRRGTAARSRLRPGFQPSGAGGRTAPDGRRSAGGAPSLAGARSRPGRLGPGPHRHRPEVERDPGRRRHRRSRLEAAGAPRRGAAGGGTGLRRCPTRSSSMRAYWRSSGRWPRKPAARPGGSPRRCARSTGSVARPSTAA